MRRIFSKIFARNSRIEDISSTARHVEEVAGDGAEPPIAVADGLAGFLFEADFYLRAYPDIAAAGVDPLQHYINHGRHEGRLGAPPKIEYIGDLASLDKTRKTVLVVTHEATLSGVPVLSFNIIKELKKRYNVIAMLLDCGTDVDKGPLTDFFREVADVLVKPKRNRRNYLIVSSVIDQLVRDCPISFAITNSIESRWALQGLARNFVPSISLIHEFAAYTRPPGAFSDAAFWSSETIFSSQLVLKDALDSESAIVASKFHVIPQGRCELPTLKIDAAAALKEKDRVLKALRPKKGDDAIVVLGAGNVHFRKGVDLFLDCAARILRMETDQKFRFVWVGRGYEPEHDSYSLFLADQVRRAGLEKHVVFLKETLSLEVAYREADIMMISSRLDPLPNVAIDAMAYGKPVMCFAGATGIANILVENGLGAECVSPYLDTADLANKTVAFMRSDTLREKVGNKSISIVRDELNMGRYVDKLVRLAEAAAVRVQQERADIEEIIKLKLANPEFLLDHSNRGTVYGEAIRMYTRAWTSQIYTRKPFAGFHPGIYMDSNIGAKNFSDPLLHYMRHGQPQGPWKNEVLTQNSRPHALDPSFRVALHVHVFYADLLPEILEKLGRNNVRPDLLVSVPNAKVKQEVTSLLGSYAGKLVALVEVPNRGRDVGPFLTEFGPTIAANYDLVGHLHTKRSPHCPNPAFIERWRYFLMENLLGGASVGMADIILGRLAEDASIGIVFPDNPGVHGWDQNRSYAMPLAEKMGLLDLPDHFLFPVGSMFWARVDALRPFFDLKLDWDDYPQEPIHHDGTMLHAIERLFGVMASRGGYRAVTTTLPGVTR